MLVIARGRDLWSQTVAALCSALHKVEAALAQEPPVASGIAGTDKQPIDCRGKWIEEEPRILG